MKRYFPHIHFWITAVFIILIGELPAQFTNNTLDLNMHDTYYIVSTRHVAVVLSSLYAFAGALYWLLMKFGLQLNQTLTKIHTFISIGTIPVYVAGLYLMNKVFNSNNDFPLFDDMANTNSFISLIILITALTQVIFMINIIIGLVKYGIQRRHRS